MVSAGASRAPHLATHFRLGAPKPEPKRLNYSLNWPALGQSSRPAPQQAEQVIRLSRDTRMWRPTRDVA